jgi:phenylacetate-CoA ligase
MAVLFQLEKTQWWSAETLQKYQFQQLGKVLVHASRTVTFYRDRFEAAGIDPTAVKTPEHLGQIPLLTRSELQKNHSALISDAIPRDHGKTFETATTGATGQPVKVASTEMASQFWKVIYLREHQWHDRDLSQKLAAIRYLGDDKAMPPNGVQGNIWGSPELHVFKTGPAVLLNIKSNIHDQADWLCRQNPGYLMSYPSNILALANHCIAEGIRLPNLQQVRTVGEILGPEVRQACREAWNAPIVDMYSCQELGTIALQCPDHEHYHVQSENLMLEVLNDQDQQCGPGETGRVVITTLHNFSMPLIRYEVGDYAKVGEPCACGRGLPVLDQVLGRQRNMLRLPDGGQFWPVFGINILAPDLPIKQFQFVQKCLDRIEARLVTERVLSEDEENHFTDVVRQHLSYPFNIDFLYLDNIPRSKGGKFEDFISEIA